MSVAVAVAVFALYVQGRRAFATTLPTAYAVPTDRETRREDNTRVSKQYPSFPRPRGRVGTTSLAHSPGVPLYHDAYECTEVANSEATREDASIDLLTRRNDYRAPFVVGLHTLLFTKASSFIHVCFVCLTRTVSWPLPSGQGPSFQWPRYRKLWPAQPSALCDHPLRVPPWRQRHGMYSSSPHPVARAGHVSQRVHSLWPAGDHCQSHHFHRQPP